MYHRAGLCDIVHNAGNEGRGLAALHLPHWQMEYLVPQQHPGPKRDFLDAILPAEVAEHGYYGVQHGQQGVADNYAVVELALVDLDHILGDSQHHLGIDKTEDQGCDKQPPWNGEPGVKRDIGAEREFLLLLLTAVFSVALHISDPPLRFPSFPDNRNWKP